MKVQHLNVAHLHLHWDVVGKFIQEALEQSGVEEYTVEQVKVYLVNKQWHLFIVEENKKICGAVVVSFANYPNGLIAFVTAIGGKFISNKQISDEFKMLLKSMGATKIQGYARESVARLWKRIGFENKQILVEYKL